MRSGEQARLLIPTAACQIDDDIVTVTVERHAIAQRFAALFGGVVWEDLSTHQKETWLDNTDLFLMNMTAAFSTPKPRTKTFEPRVV